MLPNRVGVPKATASAHSRSSRLALGSSFIFSTKAFQSSRDSTASLGAVSSTMRTRTSAPASRAPSPAASAIW